MNSDLANGDDLAELPTEDGAAAASETSPGTFEVVDQTDERVVIRIPPGSRTAKSMGWFAFFWLGMIAVVTVPALRQVVGGKEWGLLLFLALFWAVGLGMLYGWMRLRFMRVLLLLEPGRLVIQRDLLRRRWIKETLLASGTRAQLKIAYSENEIPVYQVAVQGLNGSAKFGTALPPDDKQRLADVVNAFLLAHDDNRRTGQPFPEVCPSCGSSLGRVHIDVETRDATCPACKAELPRRPMPSQTEPLPLPAESKLDLVESSPTRLLIHIPPGSKKHFGLIVFAVVWLGFLSLLSSMMLFGNGRLQMPPLPVLVVLAMLLGFGLVLVYWWIRLRFSRTILLVEPERLVVQRTLFGTKSIRETALGPGSRAALSEAYRANDDPIYEVAVVGADGRGKFGNGLSKEEQEWAIDAINRLLKVDPDAGARHENRF